MIKIIEGIIDRERQYFLALSMGVDSLAAFLWLKSNGYKIVPLHFNHGLRVQNEHMLEKFLELCSDLNVVGHFENGCGLRTEKECRDARLDFYSRIGGDIITAHHLNDWVEGYLLNCFRGHPDHTPIPLVSRFDKFRLAHPFLLSRKKDFVEYLERNDWMKYIVEDESNKISKGSRRNWVRSVILPEMSAQKISLEKFAKRKIISTVRAFGNGPVAQSG
jgi:tRNA(Ile)-lysidine synthase TilS/MesJ